MTPRVPFRRTAAPCTPIGQIASQAMIPLRLHVENIAGDWFGFIEDFPGAYASGRSAPDVEQAAPRAFADYLNWLRAHGEPVPHDLWGATSADFEVSIAYTAADSADSPADARHFMPADPLPLRADEFDRHLRLLRYSRSDLVHTAGSIPPHQWDTAPLGGRSIRALLQILADVEASLLARVGAKPTYRPHPDPLTALDRGRAATEAAVTDVFHEPASERVDADGGRWSLPKVLRLALWHERNIADQIAARSNPTKYMRSFWQGEAVIRTRDVVQRGEDRAQKVTDEVPEGVLTHVSDYYY